MKPLCFADPTPSQTQRLASLRAKHDYCRSLAYIDTLANLSARTASGAVSCSGSPAPGSERSTGCPRVRRVGQLRQWAAPPGSRATRGWAC